MIENEEKFNEFFKRYGYKLAELAEQYVVEPYEPQDVMQEMCVKIFSNMDAFDEMKAGFDTWAMTVAENAAIDFHRTCNDNTFIEYDDEELYPPVITDPNYKDPRINTIHEAIEELPDEADQRIVRLMLDGYKYREIADSTNMTESAIKKRMQRIKKKLKGIIFEAA